MRPPANGEYREVYRNQYLSGMLVTPFLTSARQTIVACMLIGL